MNGEQSRPQRRYCACGARHGVGTIVQLEIEKQRAGAGGH